MKFKNRIGEKYGRLTVIADGGHIFRGGKNRVVWRCICECGNECTAESASLGKGDTKSCGCLRRESPRERFKTHGDSRSKEYMTWKRIVTRCHNKNNPKYPIYGGRGIQMCDRWRNSYINFLEDMGRAPSIHHSIDRIDVNGHYSPENCRWATPCEQANNKRNSYCIEHNGEVKTLKQWSDFYKINYKKAHGLIKYKGLTLDQVINGKL